MVVLAGGAVVVLAGGAVVVLAGGGAVVLDTAAVVAGSITSSWEVCVAGG